MPSSTSMVHSFDAELSLGFPDNNDILIEGVVGTVTKSCSLANRTRPWSTEGRKQGTFDLWLHPNNVTTTWDCHRLKQIVSRIDKSQQKFGIETMSPVADTVGE